MFRVFLAGLPAALALTVRNILHMAGQLGLDPPTMGLVQGGATLEMHQAMKNCEAVARAFKVSLRGDAVAITIYCSAALSVKDQAEVERCLHEFLLAEPEEDDHVDGSHSQYSTRSCLKIIPNPMILFVLVPALPKGGSSDVGVTPRGVTVCLTVDGVGKARAKGGILRNPRQLRTSAIASGTKETVLLERVI